MLLSWQRYGHLGAGEPCWAKQTRINQPAFRTDSRVINCQQSFAVCGMALLAV